MTWQSFSISEWEGQVKLKKHPSKHCHGERQASILLHDLPDSQRVIIPQWVILYHTMTGLTLTTWAIVWHLTPYILPLMARRRWGALYMSTGFAREIFNRFSRHYNAPWIPSPDPKTKTPHKRWLFWMKKVRSPSITDTSLTLNSTLKPCGVVELTAPTDERIYPHDQARYVRQSMLSHALIFPGNCLPCEKNDRDCSTQGHPLCRSGIWLRTQRNNFWDVPPPDRTSLP